MTYVVLGLLWQVIVWLMLYLAYLVGFIWLMLYLAYLSKLLYGCDIKQLRLASNIHFIVNQNFAIRSCFSFYILILTFVLVFWFLLWYFSFYSCIPVSALVLQPLLLYSGFCFGTLAFTLVFQFLLWYFSLYSCILVFALVLQFLLLYSGFCFGIFILILWVLFLSLAFGYLLF